MDSIDIDALYELLTATAERKGQIQYGELSEAYAGRTGTFHEPHGTWDVPLGLLNQRLSNAGLPPLSAVVVLKDTNEPGGGFWGSCASVPARPKSDIHRVEAYARKLGDVHASTWPATLP